MMKQTATTALLLGLLIAPAALADAHAAPAGPTPDQALKQLVDGNQRYVSDQRLLPHQTDMRRCETVSGGQHPIAAVLSCADSRAPVEILFDQGIGDLFVIRVAGNVAATDEIGTIEYGVEHLNIPLIVVLGHTKCGAVTAVVDGAHVEGNLAKLIQPIVPAVNRTRDQHPDLVGPKLVGAAITSNVEQAMNDLTSRSPVIARFVREGKVKIVGGVYDLHGGNVRWLGDTALATAAPASKPAHAEPAHHAPANDHAEPPVPAAKPKPTAAAHHDVDDSHAAPSHDAPKSKATAAPASKKAEAHDTKGEHDDDHAPAKKKADDETAAAGASQIPHNWYVLGGMIGASSLIGAVVTRLIPRRAAA